MSGRGTTVANQDSFLDEVGRRCPHRRLVGSLSAAENKMRGAHLDLLHWSLVIFFLLLLLSPAPVSLAQTQFDFTPEIDRLLRNGLNKMYRYDLQEADESFDELVRRFP